MKPISRLKIISTTIVVSLLTVTINISCSSLSKIPIGTTSKKDHKLSELYVEMGVHYMEMGKLSVALEKLERAVDIDGNNANAHNSIAVLYQRIRNYDLAEDHFEEALSLGPDSSTVLNNFGGFKCKRGDIEEAMVLLNKSSELPLNERPWFSLTNAGQCVFKQGDSEQAEVYFRKALQLNRSYTPALLYMAEISYDQSEYMRTRAFLERFLSYHKATPNSLILGFLAEQALGHDNKSEEYKAQLLTRFPASEEATKIRKMQGLSTGQKVIPSRLVGAAPVVDAVDNESESKPEPEAVVESEVEVLSPAKAPFEMEEVVEPAPIDESAVSDDATSGQSEPVNRPELDIQITE